MKQYKLTSNYNLPHTRPDQWTSGLEQPGQNGAGLDVVVDTCFKFQTVKGIGASFSEIGSRSLFCLNDKDKNILMENLFSPKSGGFNYCRMPIGASDFALDAYSLAMEPEDFQMNHFSVSRDEKYLIPFIKSAMGFEPDLKIHASPWTPPHWMKNNGLMTSGGSLRDEEKVYSAYAQYFVKFAQAYENHDINIDRLIIQNETDALSAYTSCMIEPWQLIRFTTDYLYPALIKNGIKSELWAGTFRTFLDYPSHFCAADSSFIDCVKGFAFQYSVPDQINFFRQLYPSIPIMHTESLCHDSSNTQEQAASLFNDFILYMNFGCDAYTYWNMILDERSVSSWNWKQNSLIKIIRDEKRVVYNPDYHVMKMISQSVRPGYVRVASLCCSRSVTAFISPCAKKLVVLVPNLISEPVNIKLRINRDLIVNRLLESDSLNIIEINL